MQYQDRTVLGKKVMEDQKISFCLCGENALNYEKSLPFAIFDQIHKFFFNP